MLSLASIMADTDVKKVTELDRIFEEEPVGLDTFVKDEKFMGMPGGLSEVQFELVKHAERIFFPDMYPKLAEEFGGYWKDTVDTRMTNRLVAQWGKCILAGEELYDASNGRWIPVESAQAGTTVGVDEDNKTGVHSRTATFKKGHGRAFEVVTNSGLRTRVQEQHRFLTKSGYRQLRELQVGDSIAQVTRVHIENPVRLPDTHVELLGWWLGDGCMPSGKKGLTMLFADHEIASMQRYDQVCAELGVQTNYSKYGGTKCYYVTSKRNSAPGRPNPLMEIARQYRLEGKVHKTKRVPEEVFSVPDDQLRVFLARLWGTDGHVYVSKSSNTPSEIGYSTVSEGLANDVQRLLLRLGISSEIREKWNTSGDGDERFKSFEVRLRTMTDIEEFCSQIRILDKSSKQDELITALGGKLLRKNPNRDGEVRFSTIREINYIGEHDYYDLTVAGVHNYVAAGGLVNHNSGGKDLTGRICNLRIIYLLLCMRNPQEYFGMPSQDSIHTLNMASNSPQALRAFFEPMTRAVKRGWFADKADPKKSAILFDKNVEAISGHSSVEGLEGLNLILGTADEIDAFKTQGEMVGLAKRSREASTSAESVLKMLASSANTRFPKTYKQLTISYPRYKGSKIQELTIEAKEDNAKYGRSSIYFASGPYATWQANPLRKREDFELEYRKDSVEAAAKFECKPAESSNPYFRNIAPLVESATERGEPITFTYSLNTTIHEETGAETQTWEPEYEIADWFVPAPGALYAVHADLAVKGDRAGVAMSHVSGWEEREVTYVDEKNLVSVRTERLPVITNDFTIGYSADISSNPAREIQIRWARELVFDLIRLGFPILRVTYDQYQSQDSMQILDTAGIETDRVSTDINNNVWRTLKDVSTDRRLKRPKNDDLLGELKALIDLGRKVDHPPTSGKDLADAFASSIVGAIELGGSEGTDVDDVVSGASIFSTPVGLSELALPEEQGVLLGNMLPIGMTLEAPFGPN